MGKLVRGWGLVRQVLGPYLADRLQNGQPIDIAASNGQIYRIEPNIEKLINLTTMETYCVHPVDGMDYCFPDMIVLWWDYLHLKVEELERAVGGPGQGHRYPYWEGEFDNPQPRRGWSRVESPVERIINNTPTFINTYQQIWQDPRNIMRMLEYMPQGMRQKMDIIMSNVCKYISDGSLSLSTEVREVVGNDEDEEDEAGEAEGGLEADSW